VGKFSEGASLQREQKIKVKSKWHGAGRFLPFYELPVSELMIGLGEVGIG